MDRDASIKVLVQAKHVPTGATVTKATGEKEYALVRSINLYAEGRGVMRLVEPAPDTVFLVDKATATQVSEDTIIGWRTTPEELWDAVREEREDK